MACERGRAEPDGGQDGKKLDFSNGTNSSNPLSSSSASGENRWLGPICRYAERILTSNLTLSVIAGKIGLCLTGAELC